MSIFALIRRELASAFFYDARRALFLFGAAMAYLILFGILYYPGVVKEIPTVICDESLTAYSRVLTRGFDDDERLKGTSPARTLTIKVAIYWILSVLSFALICAISALLGIPNRAGLTDLFFIASAFSFTAIALGACCSAFFTTELQYVRASIMYTVPAFIFGGYTWPLEAMDPVTLTIAKAFPMAWMSNAIRDLFLSGHFASLMTNVTVLLGMGVFFMLIGSAFYLRRMHRL